VPASTRLVLPAWAVALLAAGCVLVTGVLPAHDAGTILGRIAPVLLFLVAITVVAQLAQNAGVFDAAAHLAARRGRGRTWLLWLLLVVLATAATIVLSLDTTAVLLTPVALALAAQIGISPALFAMTTVWLADTASMLLPVSNLTNLLARTGSTRSALACGRTCRSPGCRPWWRSW
jgi:arsenical pump membrane protein